MDKDLVKKAQAGDKVAFDQLVLKHQAKLLSVVNQYIKDPSESLDVLQETFIKAYQSIKDFRADSAFYTWIYRIAVNTAKNHLVHLERRPPQSDYSIDAAELKDPEAMAAKHNGKHPASRELLKAFEALPKHLQEILTLREIGGFSYAEIAKFMDIPVGTVRSRISRARKLLLKP